MPLYLDLHEFDNISIEDMKRDHVADKAVQAKHNVKILQFWVNKKAGKTFCLIEGPNPDACAAVHREAHGHVFCIIQEVEPGFFKLFMGEGLPVENDMTLTDDGEMDPGDRTIVGVNFISKLKINEVGRINKIQPPTKPKDLVIDIFRQFKGRLVQNTWDDTLFGVFNAPLHAIRCAFYIRNDLLRYAQSGTNYGEWNVTFRIGINHGMPLTKKEGFFEMATKQAQRLGMIALPNQIAFSANLKTLFEEMEPLAGDSAPVTYKILAKPDEEFINELFDLVEQNQQKINFNVTHFAEKMGMSRTQI